MNKNIGGGSGKNVGEMHMEWNATWKQKTKALVFCFHYVHHFMCISSSSYHIPSTFSIPPSFYLFSLYLKQERRKLKTEKVIKIYNQK